MSEPSASIASCARSCASAGRAVHQHARVLEDQPRRRREDDARDDERRHRVALLEARVDQEEAGQHRQRPGHVAREVEGVRAQGGGAVPARGAQRDRHARDVDEQRDADDGVHVPVGLERLAAAREAADRLDEDDDPAAGEDGRLAERRQVLRAPVPVGVRAVGGARAEAQREQREDGGDHVARGLDAGRDEAEGAGEQAGAELEHDEERRGDDRGERREVLAARVLLALRRDEQPRRGLDGLRREVGLVGVVPGRSGRILVAARVHRRVTVPAKGLRPVPRATRAHRAAWIATGPGMPGQAHGQGGAASGPAAHGSAASGAREEEAERAKDPSTGRRRRHRAPVPGRRRGRRRAAATAAARRGGPGTRRLVEAARRRPHDAAADRREQPRALRPDARRRSARGTRCRRRPIRSAASARRATGSAASSRRAPPRRTAG